VFELVLDRLDNHNGVVHHDADGQDQAEQRQIVQTEPDERHDGKSAHDRNRNGCERNNRGPPRLEEKEDDDGDQDERFKKRVVHGVDGFVDERCRVVHDLEIDARGKGPLQLGHLVLDAIGRLEGVGAWQLINGQPGGGLAVQGARRVL